MVALQLGSIAVVIEGALSGSIALSSLINFTGLMQAIHLPIRIIEVIVTAAILALSKFVSSQKLSITSGAMSMVLAGFISQYASQKPDGLEWSLLNISNAVEMQTQGILYNLSETFQAKSTIFAGMPVTTGSLAGLFWVCVIMYLACMSMAHQPVKVDE